MKRIVARELYDHRKGLENGYMEKVNLAGRKGFAEVVARLSEQLDQLGPHKSESK